MLGAALLLASASAEAHRTALTVVRLSVEGPRVRWSTRLAAEDLAPWLGLPGWWVPSRERVQGALPSLAQRVARGVTVEAQGGCARQGAPEAGLEPEPAALGGYRVVVTQGLRCVRSVEALALRYELLFEHDPTHRALVEAELAGGAAQRVLDAEHREARFEAAVRPWQSAREYLRLGVEHLLQGYDHLAFLLALLVLVAREPGRRPWRSALAVATSFTLAHSLTLALAALGWLRLPSRPVEVAIALSIALVCADNARRTAAAARWPAGLLFGLVHGLGFAGALAEVGLPQRARALALGFFNVGVELGQLAAVLALLPLLVLLARPPVTAARALRGLAPVLLFSLVLAREGVALPLALGALPVAALALCGASRRWGYERAAQRGLSALLGACALLWALERATGRTLLRGWLG